MGTLITIVGNSGAGKTTLAKVLHTTYGFECALEQHQERPFQTLFAQDLQRYALANQLDYLLLRAEQEYSIRTQPGIIVQDGGLDVDFWIFTKLFQQRAYLSEAEYQLCERFYRLFRALNPYPDLVIWLHVPVQMALQRYQKRHRSLEIAQADDIKRIDALLQAWLQHNPPPSLLTLDASHQDPMYTQDLQNIHAILQFLGLIK